MEGRDERRPPWLSSDFVMMLVCGIILQLILTLDYGAIARVTKEVMQEVYAPVADASAAGSARGSNPTSPRSSACPRA